MGSRARAAIVLSVVVATLIGVTAQPAGAARGVGQGQVRCEGVIKVGAAQNGAIQLPDFSFIAFPVVTVNGNLDCVGTTGDPRATLRKVRIRSTMSRPWHCGYEQAFTGVKRYPWTVDLKWRAAGRQIEPTRVTFPGWLGIEKSVGGADASSFTLPAAPGDVSTVTGSYASSQPTLSLVFIRNFTYAYHDYRCHPTSPTQHRDKVTAVLTF
jgi:hypothetical protein